MHPAVTTPDAPRHPTGRDRLRGLDDLRGVLVLIVVIAHWMGSVAPALHGRSPLVYDGLNPRSPWSVSARGAHTTMLCFQGYAPARGPTLPLRGLALPAQPERTGPLTNLLVRVGEGEWRPAAANQYLADMTPYLDASRLHAGWTHNLPFADLAPGPGKLEFLAQYAKGQTDILSVNFTSKGRPSLWILEGQWPRGIAEIAMDTFFMLSGFLIMLQLIRARDAPGLVWTFYVRRALRILPPALLVVLAVWFLWPTARGHLWPFGLFCVNYLGSESMHHVPALQHYWSLAIEEQYYLLAPILFILLPRKWLWPLNALLFIGLFAWRLTVPEVFDALHTYAFRTHLRGYTITAGQLIALWYCGWAPPMPRLGVRGWALAGCGLAGLTAWGAWTNRIGILEFPGLALTAWFIVRCARGRPPFEQAVLRYCGLRCYGIYLVHLPVLRLLPSSWSPLAKTAALLAGVLLVVEFSYRFIEGPLLRRAPRYRKRGAPG
jgi:peptidoglycan/LPS O-acetylase OafA/YrhL